MFLLSFEDFSNNAYGVLLAFCCAFSWGTELVLSSIVLKDLPTTSVYFSRQAGASFGYVFLLLIYAKNLGSIFAGFLSFSFLYLMFFSCFSMGNIVFFVLLFYLANRHHKSYDAKYFICYMACVDRK